MMVEYAHNPNGSKGQLRRRSVLPWQENLPAKALEATEHASHIWKHTPHPLHVLKYKFAREVRGMEDTFASKWLRACLYRKGRQMQGGGGMSSRARKSPAGARHTPKS